MENLVLLKNAIEKTKQILRTTKKNKGDLYLVNFFNGKWEKCPNINSLIKVTDKAKLNLFNQKGKIIGFKINNIDSGEEYCFLYKIHLVELDLDIELFKEQFEEIKDIITNKESK